MGRVSGDSPDNDPTRPTDCISVSGVSGNCRVAYPTDGHVTNPIPSMTCGLVYHFVGLAGGGVSGAPTGPVARVVP